MRILGVAAVAKHAGKKGAQQQAAADQQAADQQAAAAAAAPVAAVPVAAAPVAAAPVAAPAGIDMAKLQQLGELHASGVLTDEEFAAEKAKVLAAG